MLAASDPASVITAIGAAIAAILGGSATVIAALNRRTAKATEAKVNTTSDQVATTNGATLSSAVEQLRGEVAEQRPLIEWARIKRAQELGAPESPTATDIHQAEGKLVRRID